MSSEIMVRKAVHEYKVLDPALETECLATTKAKMMQGAFQPLGPERENSLFLLFLLGDDLETVAFKSGVPKAVVTVTADRYDWVGRRSMITECETKDPVKGLQRSIVSMILAATAIAVRKEIEGVMAGTIEPKDATYVPSNVFGIQKLISLMREIEGVTLQSEGGAANGGTTVQATNVQILQQVAPQSDEAKELSAKERSEFLRQLAGTKR